MDYGLHMEKYSPDQHSLYCRQELLCIAKIPLISKEAAQSRASYMSMSSDHFHLSQTQHGLQAAENSGTVGCSTARHAEQSATETWPLRSRPVLISVLISHIARLANWFVTCSVASVCWEGLLAGCWLSTR